MSAQHERPAWARSMSAQHERQTWYDTWSVQHFTNAKLAQLLYGNPLRNFLTRLSCTQAAERSCRAAAMRNFVITDLRKKPSPLCNRGGRVLP